MNERIGKLAVEAVTRFDKDMDGSMEPEESGRWVQFEDLEKFAELIVKECANICITENLSNLDLDVICGSSKFTIQDLATESCGKNLSKKIKKHFGVDSD